MIVKVGQTIICGVIFLFFVNEIWKNDIDIFKSIKKYALSAFPLSKKFIEPKLNYKIEHIPQRISEGIEVYNIP